MMNHILRSATIDGHVKRIEDELRTEMRGHCPTYDATTVDVEHDRNEQETTPRWNVGVSSPRESHPRALAEPDVNLSAHPAPIIEPPT